MPKADVSKFRGALLGAAIGDALGAPYEHSKAASLEIQDEYLTGVYGTEPGASTDDSTLLSLHAQAWIDWNEKADLSVDNYYVLRLVEWADSSPPDIGGQTSAAIKSHKKGIPVKDTGSCGNGSLMAVAPSGLMGSNTTHAGRLGYNFSLNTHPNELCRYVCSNYSAAIYTVSRYDPYTRPYNTYRITLPAHMSIDGPSQGYVAIAAALAFTALDKVIHNDLSAYGALKWIIELGGDTDTNASIAGALIGAAFGEAVWETPNWLLEELDNRDNWIKTADQLHEVCFS